MDFLNRIDIKAVGKSVIEKLIQTGSFDNLGKRRETLLGNLEQAVEYIQKIKDGKKFGQGSLFGDTGEKEYQDFKFEEFPEISKADKLKTEKELIGFYFSAHPMDEYQTIWQDMVKADLGNPETLVLGSQILIGLIKNVKIITTSRGERMAFATLEDYNGEIELTFFPAVWEKCREKTENDKAAVLKGKIDYQQNRDKHSFTVDECLELSDAGIAAENVQRGDKEDTQRWERFENLRKYAKDMDLNLLNLGEKRAEAGIYIAVGVLKSIRTHIDKKGNEMAFGSLQDPSGEIDLLFFARTWENCKAKAIVDETLAIKGTVEAQRGNNSGKNTLIVSSIQDVNKLVRGADKKALQNREEAPDKIKTKTPNKEMHIRLAAGAAENEEALNSLKNCIEENPGSCPVYIHIPVSCMKKESSPDKISPETIIRAASFINADTLVSLGAVEKCPAVADLWCTG
jgi:DNA polymerase-3 subunit alpha